MISPGDAKNGTKWQKNSVWCTSYLRDHISYDCHLWYTCVKWWYLHVFFFIFSKFCFSGLLVGTGRRGVKNCLKWEKIMSVVLGISGMIHHMIIIFVTHNCKMMSPIFFYLFIFFSISSKFWFFGLIGGSKGKNGPEWQKSLCFCLSFVLYISGTRHHMILIYGKHV